MVHMLALDSSFRMKHAVFVVQVCPQWLPNNSLLAVALCIVPCHMSSATATSSCTVFYPLLCSAHLPQPEASFP